MRAKTGESVATRFGCKYADQYYAGEFNISEELAREIYCCKVAVFNSEAIPECPFNFLDDCPVANDVPTKFMQGLVTGLLGDRVLTCKLLPVELSPSKGAHQCSECGNVIRGDTTFMYFCYRCGRRIK